MTEYFQISQIKMEYDFFLKNWEIYIKFLLKYIKYTLVC